jgi:hypothetical protein
VGGCQFIRNGTAWLSLNSRSDDAKRSAWNWREWMDLKGMAGRDSGSNHQTRWKSFVGLVTINALVATEPCRLLPTLVSKVPAKVNSSRPNRRFVIALHSLNVLLETGLRVCPPEKSQENTALAVERSFLRSLVC